MTSDATCWICGSGAGADTVGEYLRCRSCGHRAASAGIHSGAVDNGLLARSIVASCDSLTSDQVRLAVNASARCGSLLDVGSGTGKFLFHASNFFEDVTGIEISTASVRFAREELHLQIVTSVTETTGPFDVVTAWHSLEHIPGNVLSELLPELRERCHAETRILVCVPNPDSPAAIFFGSRWAFRDTESHLHEFSRQSLDLLFARHNFSPLNDQRLWSYTFFAWVQTLLNLMPGPHNYLYYRLKRGRRYFAMALIQWLADCYAFAMLPLMLPVGAACAAFEHTCLKRTSVHLITYVQGPTKPDDRVLRTEPGERL